MWQGTCRGCHARPVNEPPTFKYHPDPVATGSLVESTETCDRCGLARGLNYAGTPYAVDEIETICAWCIADGSAAREFDAVFTDVGLGVPADVPEHVREEVAHRTPGFIGWQQEHWMFHCSDAAAFLGLVGWDDVADLPDAVGSLRSDLAEIGVGTAEADWQIKMMRRDGDLTGYLFRCLHCGTHLAYSDAS